MTTASSIGLSLTTCDTPPRAYPPQNMFKLFHFGHPQGRVCFGGGYPGGKPILLTRYDLGSGIPPSASQDTNNEKSNVPQNIFRHIRGSTISYNVSHSVNKNQG